MDKLLETPSFKAIMFLIGTFFACSVTLIPFAHGYIVKDIEASVTNKVHKIEADLGSLSAKTELNHQLLMQEFKLFKEDISRKIDRVNR